MDYFLRSFPFNASTHPISTSSNMFSSFTRSGLLAIALAAASTLASDISIKVTGESQCVAPNYYDSDAPCLGPDAVTSVDDFTLKTVITNHGADTVKLLNDPNSVLTPHWKTNSFGIVGPAGTAAEFGGIKVSPSPVVDAPC